MKTQGKYIEKPYSFRTRFRMVIVAVGCSTSKIENYFKDPFAVGDPPRSCKWNMCKLQGNVIAERAPNGFSMFALHLGKKKTRPLQRVSNFNSPVSPPWRHPIFTKSFFSAMTSFFQRSKAMWFAMGLFFTKKYFGRLVGHTSYVRGLLWHTELPHILSGPKRVAHRVCVERAEKMEILILVHKALWCPDGLDQISSKSCVLHRCIIGLDEEIIHQLIGKLSL